ncbi:MAG: hypothetical protein CM15mP127_03350 [Gammaproteobacteria bacterium]|nr:MAG: hypothetical protein CM15mP127_03350 [Gammaproteobacteria bacterium]
MVLLLFILDSPLYPTARFDSTEFYDLVKLPPTSEEVSRRFEYLLPTILKNIVDRIGISTNLIEPRSFKMYINLPGAE